MASSSMKNGKILLLRALVREALLAEIALDPELEAEIKQVEREDDGQYDDRHTYIAWAKEQSYDVYFSTAELQYIARNETGMPYPPPNVVREIKQEILTAPGVKNIKWSGREPKPKPVNVRTSRFAGMHGGTGTDSLSGHIGMGGREFSRLRGGQTFDPTDPGSPKMLGIKRR